MDNSTFTAPPFPPENLGLFFWNLEINFEAAEISDDKAQFDFVCSVLDDEDLEVVKDVLSNPPATNKYETLKKALLEPSEQKQLRTYKLQMAQFGNDQTPTEFLEHLREIGGKYVSKDYVETVWFAYLPGYVRRDIDVDDDIETSLKLAEKRFNERIELVAAREKLLRPQFTADNRPLFSNTLYNMSIMYKEFVESATTETIRNELGLPPRKQIQESIY